MKKGWEIKKLGEVCEIELGKTPYRKDKSYWDTEKQTNNVWLSISDLLNVNDKFVSDSKEYISDKAVSISKIVKKGTLLLSFKLTIGRLAFAGRDLFTNEAIAALSIKDDELIDKFYLYNYLLFFDWDKATEGERKVKGKTLNKAKLKELEIIIPPLPEQKRIVSILDRAFEAIDQAKANAEQNLKNAKELFQSKLQAIFDNGKLKIENGEWEDKTLGEVCSFVQGIQRGVKLQSEVKKENQVRFLRIIDYTQGNEPPRYIDNPGEKYILNNKDIALVRYGASTGFVCRGIEGALANNMFRVIPKVNSFSKDFLYVFLIAPTFQNYIKESMNGAAMPAISFGMIRDIHFYFPKSLETQKQIVSQLDKLQSETKKLEAIYQKKIEDLEELKKSILQKAFNGEL